MPSINRLPSIDDVQEMRLYSYKSVNLRWRPSPSWAGTAPTSPVFATLLGKLAIAAGPVSEIAAAIVTVERAIAGL